MGKIIPLITNKGGSGKTTTSTNLAVALAKQNKKTIVVDLDGQCSVQFCFGFTYKDTKDKTLWDVINNETKLENCIFSVDQNVMEQKNINFLFGNTIFKEWDALILAKKELEVKLEGILNKLKENFDYVIIDTSPQMSKLNELAIKCADMLILPYELNQINVYSLFATLSTIEIMEDKWKTNKKKLIVANKMKMNLEKEVKISKAYQNLYSILSSFVETSNKNIIMSKTKIADSSQINLSIEVNNYPVMMSKSSAKTLLKIRNCYEDLANEVIELID